MVDAVLNLPSCRSAALFSGRSCQDDSRNAAKALARIFLALAPIVAFHPSDVPRPVGTLKPSVTRALPAWLPGSRSQARSSLQMQQELARGFAKIQVVFEGDQLSLSSDTHAIGSFPPIFGNLDEEVFSATPSPSGGIFLHTTWSKTAAEHLSSLGQLHCERLLACARVTRNWMGPAFGTGAKDVPPHTQFLLLELAPSGPYVLLLPLVDGRLRATLQYGNRGRVAEELLLHVESGDASVVAAAMRNALYIAAGVDPFDLVKRGMAEVAQTLGTFQPLDKKRLPQSVNSFGWCTWDAFYSQVKPDDVLHGVRTLSQAKVPPRFVIIDDGWQTVEPCSPADEEILRAESSSDAHGNLSTTGQAVNVGLLRGAFAGCLARLREVLLRLIVIMLTPPCTWFYQKCVHRAAHGSPFATIWRILANTILKKPQWKFFNDLTDFHRQISSFSANPKFEKAGSQDRTLKQLVSALKTSFGVCHVYCWHALHGYWRGASASLGASTGIPIKQVPTKPSHHLLTLEPALAWDAVTLWGVGLVTHPDHASALYSGLHTPLAAAGVDGVKVDVQSGVSALAGAVGGGPALGKLYVEAMEASVAKHFGTKTEMSLKDGGARAEDGGAGQALHCINCMCHSTETLYNYKHTAIARASDDFYPDQADSHTRHLVNVAYNSMFLGEICLPDWDMFHSLHKVGSLHAAARAVGGCPVYVSDKPGRHDSRLLQRLVLPDGSVLRAQLPGRPTRDCLFADVGADGATALKIWNVNSFGGVIGAFNVQGVVWSFKTRENVRLETPPPHVTALVRPSDIEAPGMSDGAFAVWRHTDSAVQLLPSADTFVEVEIGVGEWEIFTIVPTMSLAAVTFAPFGLGKMLNSGGALLDVGKLVAEHDKATGHSEVHATLSCRGPGIMHAYSQPAPKQVMLLDDVRTHEPQLLSFRHNAKSGKLEIDLVGMRDDETAARLAVVWDADVFRR